MITNEVQLKLEALLLIDDSQLSERWREFAMTRGFSVESDTQALVIQCRNREEAFELSQSIAKTITLIAYLVQSPIRGVDFRWAMVSGTQCPFAEYRYPRLSAFQSWFAAVSLMQS